MSSGNYFLRVTSLFMLVASSALCSTFSAHVDKTSVAEGRSITLTLELDDATDDEPELALLAKEFRIQGRQRAQESHFVNGSRKRKTTWTLELLPKSSAKTLTIPSITLGNLRTAPIAIVQAEASASSAREDGIEVTLSADRRDVYVHGELIVTIFLKAAMTLHNATLSKPEVSDAIVELLSEGERSEAVEHGIKYTTYKQSYAVYPNKPGALSVAPIIFRGVASTGNNGGGGGSFGGFFSRGKSVSARSNQLAITVKDVPKEFPQGQPFLPLKSFTVIESFDEPNPQFEVNKATTRRFEIRAKGTLASFLPNVLTPAVKELPIYSETGNKLQKSETDGILATAKFSHIYMPIMNGAVKVPEQIIYWWDVDEDKLKTTPIRALDLMVQGDVVTPPQQPIAPPQIPAATTAPVLEEPPQNMPPPAPSSAPTAWLWPTLALLFLVLWLTTLGFFLWQQRRSRTSASPHAHITPAQALAARVHDVTAACATNDAKKVYATLSALLAWRERERVAVANLAPLQSLHKDLERALYTPAGANVNDIVTNIKRELKSVGVIATPSLVVAPLYPS